MTSTSAVSLAAAAVAGVRDDPVGRLFLMRRLYEHPVLGKGRLLYLRAATAFMQWQLRRSVLDPAGSPWWRAVNEDLIRVTAEARYLAGGAGGEPSSPAVIRGLEFIDRPTAQRWYLAHNTAIVSAYFDHRDWWTRRGDSSASS